MYNVHVGQDVCINKFIDPYKFDTRVITLGY